MSLIEHPEGEFWRHKLKRAPGGNGSDFEKIDQTSRLMIQAPIEEPPPTPPAPPPAVENQSEDGLWSSLDPAASAGQAPAPLTSHGPEQVFETHVQTADAPTHRWRAPRAGAMVLAGMVAAVVVGLVLFAGLLSPGGSPRSAAVQHSEATGAATAIHKTGDAAVKPSTKSRAVAKRTTAHPRQRASSHANTKRRGSARRSSPVRHTSAAHRTAVSATPTASGGSSTSSYTPDSSSSPARSSTPPAQQTLTHTQSGPTGLGYEVGTGCDPTCR